MGNWSPQRREIPLALNACGTKVSDNEQVTSVNKNTMKWLSPTPSFKFQNMDPKNRAHSDSNVDQHLNSPHLTKTSTTANPVFLPYLEYLGNETVGSKCY